MNIKFKMSSEVVAYFLLTAAAVPVVLGYEPDGFEHMYDLGKESYLEENWGYCVKFMEEAVRDYNSYRVSCSGFLEAIPIFRQVSHRRHEY